MLDQVRQDEEEAAWLAALAAQRAKEEEQDKMKREQKQAAREKVRISPFKSAPSTDHCLIHSPQHQSSCPLSDSSCNE